MLFIFTTPVLIRHPWQLKTVVFLHRCLIRAVLLSMFVQFTAVKMFYCCGLEAFVMEILFITLQKYSIGFFLHQTKAYLVENFTLVN